VGVLTTASEVPLPRRRRVDRAVDITSSSSSSEGERLDDEEDAEVVVVDDSQPQSPAKGADPPSPFDGLVNEQSMPSHRRSSELGRDGSGEGELPSSTPPLTMGDGQRDGSPSEKPAPPFKPSEHLRTLLWEQNNWVRTVAFTASLFITAKILLGFTQLYNVVNEFVINMEYIGIALLYVAYVVM
jgi:hypothetical protein